jgi:hypothetical protein
MVIDFICPGLRAQLLDVLTPAALAVRPGEVVAGLIQLLDWVLGLGAACSVLVAFLVCVGRDLVRRKHAD